MKRCVSVPQRNPSLSNKNDSFILKQTKLQLPSFYGWSETQHADQHFCAIKWSHVDFCSMVSCSIYVESENILYDVEFNEQHYIRTSLSSSSVVLNGKFLTNNLVFSRVPTANLSPGFRFDFSGLHSDMKRGRLLTLIRSMERAFLASLWWRKKKKKYNCKL